MRGRGSAPTGWASRGKISVLSEGYSNADFPQPGVTATYDFVHEC